MPRSARAWLAVVLSALVAPRAISAQSPAAADSALLGLWGVEASLGPQVSGPLELERTAAGWRMHVAGFAATTPDTASTIPLPGGQGMLRLAQSNGGTLRAFWVQPPGNVPMPMATPVQLARVCRASGAEP